jgi:23S rRNA G2445 N2-methylase RlmL
VRRDCPRWRVADPAEIELWVLEYRPGSFVAGVRVSDVSMRQHGGREAERRGALRPTVAAAMVRLAGKSRGALLDPCCGSGTILGEAAARDWQARGSDIDPVALRVARRNARAPLVLADARELPVRDGSAGACVTNLPFGRQYEVEGDPAVWLGRVLAEMTRVTRPKGRVVVLTPSVPKATLPNALREVRRAPLVLLGTRTTIWSYERA